MADSPNVVNVTAETFARVVIDGSHDRPVLVDFWADWCAPCRMLMPILTRLADDYGGKLLVAKVDTEAERELAVELSIRSLPTVMLFNAGKPIDQFMGALPEAQIRDFLERHLPRESDALLDRVNGLLGAGEVAGASALVEQARSVDPENPRLVLADASVKAAAGDTREAEALLDRVPLEIHDDPEVAALRAQLRFANVIADAPSEEMLRTRLEADPKDSAARYQLAAHLIIRHDMEGALAELLELLRRDRSYGEDAARKAMLMVFDMLGGESALVAHYRSRMLNALY
jgi:putative thioredoxin